MIISRHYLRRRARQVARRLNRQGTTVHYTVEPAKRGPYRWYVIAHHD